jgi:hypothetical protein
MKPAVTFPNPTYQELRLEWDRNMEEYLPRNSNEPPSAILFCFFLAPPIVAMARHVVCILTPRSPDSKLHFMPTSSVKKNINAGDP